MGVGVAPERDTAEEIALVLRDVEVERVAGWVQGWSPRALGGVLAVLAWMVDYGVDKGILGRLVGVLHTGGPELDAAHLFVYFTDPTSPDRMLLAGPGLPKGERNAAVDPRDLFPTVAILARVPVPGTVQGVDLLAD